MNIAALVNAKNEWDSFLMSLKDSGNKSLSNLSESIECIDLHYYASIKDYIRCDQIINNLTSSFLFDEEIISTVFNIYIERGLFEQAYNYINNGVLYYEKSGLTVPPIFNELKDKYPKESLINNLKISFSTLINLSPKDIPRIIPERLNGNIKLKEFILFEIIQGLRIMRKKIQAVETLHLENKYNDVFLVTLRLRLPIWGWEIVDQERSGSSTSGIDAGEIDFFIRAAGMDIALIEAFVLTGSDFTKTSKHILKCENYVRDLKNYYIITYYIGYRSNFNSTWNSYKENVLKIIYPPGLSLTSDFINLNENFENVSNFKIARTNHENEIEFYHIMIDLS